MKLTQIIGKKIAVHCKTEDEAKEVCRIMNDGGIKFHPLFEDFEFSLHNKETCLDLERDSIQFCMKGHYIGSGFKIITAKSFIDANTDGRKNNGGHKTAGRKKLGDKKKISIGHIYLDAEVIEQLGGKEAIRDKCKIYLTRIKKKLAK